MVFFPILSLYFRRIILQRIKDYSEVGAELYVTEGGSMQEVIAMDRIEDTIKMYHAMKGHLRQGKLYINVRTYNVTCLFANIVEIKLIIFNS